MAPRAWPTRWPASLRACGGRAPISRLASASGERSPAWSSRTCLRASRSAASAIAASAASRIASTCFGLERGHFDGVVVGVGAGHGSLSRGDSSSPQILEVDELGSDGDSPDPVTSAARRTRSGAQKSQARVHDGDSTPPKAVHVRRRRRRRTRHRRSRRGGRLEVGATASSARDRPEVPRARVPSASGRSRRPAGAGPARTRAMSRGSRSAITGAASADRVWR